MGREGNIKVSIMKDLCCVMVADDGDVFVTTDYSFSESDGLTLGTARQTPLYQQLVKALRQSPPACQLAVQLLESARKEARYDYDGKHPELESALKAWRRDKAAMMNVPAYYVLHQRVLLAIADAAPASADDLLAIPGFGPGLFSRYGEELLAIVREH